MRRGGSRARRRATVLLMIVGLLAMLFMIISAYLVLARYDRQTLTLSSQAQRMGEIVESVNDIISTGLRGRMAHLVVGADAADTPGFTQDLAGGTYDPNFPAVWGAPWASAPEALRTEMGAVDLDEVELPYTSNVGVAAIRPRTIAELMLDANQDGGITPDPDSPDTRVTVQQGFMDADGDGVPDTDFAGSALLTELANAIAGRAVRAADIEPSMLNSFGPDLNYYRWSQFESQARYLVAARVLSHGGLVELNVPNPDVAPWNADFTTRMFDWIRSPDDRSLDLYDPRGDRPLLHALGSGAAMIEPLLRRRGGLLPAYGEEETLSGRVPRPLWEFEYQFPRTAVLDYGPNKSVWQRFNIASPVVDEWDLWVQAATLSADAYNADPDPSRLTTYARRKYLTTVNNSDELARLRSPALPDPNNPNPIGQDPNDPNWPGPGLRPGALKYYLGKITDTRRARDVLGNGYTNTLLGAFKPDGTFNDSDEIAVGGRGIPQGFAVIAELRDYFYEMLADYDEWDSPSGEAVSRNEQAWMLAVNTVAFAAPRAPRDTTKLHVDTVYIAPDAVSPGVPDRYYIGYAPQLYITQIVAYNNPDPGPPPSPSRVALAIELYNPHDSAVDHDYYDLDLDRFAISVNSTDPNDSVAFRRLSQTTPPPTLQFLPGRSFMLVSVNDNGANTYFENYPNAPAYPLGRPRALNIPVPYTVDGTPIKVYLWRRGSAGDLMWYVVDRFDVQTDFTAGGIGSPGKLGARQQWYVNVDRDTSWEPYLGRWKGQSGREARWRMATAFRPTVDGAYHVVGSPVEGAAPGDPVITQLGVGTPNPADPGFPTQTFQPAVPLYTANPDLGATVYLHGAARPAAFPTVGFMLYVPRYSHVWQPGAPEPYVPMGVMLAEAWKRRTPTTLAEAPADFGHMPVFDNRQDVVSYSHFDESNRAGRLPWGLAVFDCFTTINPDDGDGDGVPVQYDYGDYALDPYRIPGRININAAPWFLLAGLPVIGPNSQGDLPLREAVTGADTGIDPAFWSADAGILAGVGAVNPFDDRSRFPTTGDSPGEILIDTRDATQGQWYRLGPYLAQAITAYRDRVQYVQSRTYSPVTEAHRRNDGGGAERPYRPQRYGEVRGELDMQADPNNPQRWKRGFLSLGELANVAGFDGSSATELQLGADATVLGGYSAASPTPDFMKAVSLLALLDTHFLTTRSNTFTVYVTLADRDNPAASLRCQTTIDRTPLLPRLIWEDLNQNGQKDAPATPGSTNGDRYNVIAGSGRPELIGQREISYYNARYDE